MRLAAGGFGNTEEDQQALAAWLSSKLTGDPNAFAEDVEDILGGTALEDDQGIQLLAHHNNPNLTSEGNVTAEGLTNAREASGEPFGVGFGGVGLCWVCLSWECGSVMEVWHLVLGLVGLGWARSAVQWWRFEQAHPRSNRSSFYK